eukprot:TRINITY_DN29835_c0_g1_i1.p1 TRINITY_DN29835_c0_g1~~TRINITY_DN29835_c0_g1_i1.p1  ORF type:complete len:2142 (+),score=675.61 TRINITY_DN29835_c0_g1_i1:1451-7876(+)
MQGRVGQDQCKVCRCRDVDKMRRILTKAVRNRGEDALAPVHEWQIPCKGFRCEHVHDDYTPVLPPPPDDGKEPSTDLGGFPRPWHYRVPVKKLRASDLDQVVEVMEGAIDDRPVYPLTREEWEAHGNDYNTKFIKQVLDTSRNPGLVEECFRTCECGWRLGPLDLARCVCGRFDFQHVPKEAKRQRFSYLRKHTRKPQDAAERRRIEKDLTWLAFFAGPVTRQPTHAEVQRTTTRIISHLSNGFSRTSRGACIKKSPPMRKGIPVVTVLFNGDTDTEKFDLVQQVQRRWPIVAIAGSGGYADVLVNTMQRVRRIVRDRDAAAAQKEDPGNKRQITAEAGLDDYRLFLSSVDSLTAEIIINGKIEIMRKGRNNKEFVRRIEISLGGDETLQKTWAKFAKWERNARIQQKHYESAQSRVLQMQVATTTLSCVQTFVKLVCATRGTEGQRCPGGSQWPNFPDAPDSSYTGLELFFWILWTMLEWSIISLPIAISFLQALINREQSGAKYVQLKEAAEKLLSEIYKYRTKTLGYSQAEVKRHSRHSHDQGEADATGLRYSSRGELLEIKARELTDQLSQSDEVSHLTLEPYLGDLPPSHIRLTGDTNHLADLVPHDYIKYRLTAKIDVLETETERVSKDVTGVHFGINCCNGAGTLLAAIAAYGLGYVQAWVALTTALAVSLTRFLDYRRLEWSLKRSNKLKGDLENTASWWSSLGSGADNRHNRNDLVGQTERLIVDDTTQWARQIQSTLEKAVTEEERQRERDAALKALEGAEGVDEKAKLRDLGASHEIELEDLSSENILASMNDPVKLKKLNATLFKLSEKGLAPVPTDVMITRTQQGQSLGLTWRGEKEIILKCVAEGSPADEAGASRFKDRRCTHCNGTPVSSEGEFKAAAASGSVTLRFDKTVVPSSEESMAVAAASAHVATLGRRMVRADAGSDDQLLYEMKLPSVGVCDFVPLSARDVLLHPDTRRRFLEELLRPVDASDVSKLHVRSSAFAAAIAAAADGGTPVLSRWRLLQHSKVVPDLHAVLKDVRSRQLLEMVKVCVVEHLVDHVLAICGQTTKGKSGLRRADIVPKVSPDFKPGSDQDPLVVTECLISELRALATTEDVELLDSNSLVNILKDPRVKETFRQLDDASRKALRDAACSLWKQKSGELTALPKPRLATDLLHDLVDRIAEHDMEELLDSPEVRVKLWARLPKIQEFRRQGDLGAMSKVQLLDFLPASIAKRLKDRSQLQIQRCMVLVSRGTQASMIFTDFSVASSLDPQSADAEFKVADMLDLSTDDAAELRERLTAVVSSVSQSDINRMSKGVLLRKLKVCSVYDSRVDEFVRTLSESNLRCCMSSIWSRLRNLHGPRVVDRLADYVQSIDIRGTIPVEHAIKLVRKVQEFRILFQEAGRLRAVDLRTLDKLELLRMLGSHVLVRALEVLSKNQLCELLEALTVLIGRSFPVRVLQDLRVAVRSNTLGHRCVDALREWGPEFVEHLMDVFPKLNLEKLAEAVARQGPGGLDEHNERASKRRLSEMIEAQVDDMELVNGIERFETAANSRGEAVQVVNRLLLDMLRNISRFHGEKIVATAFETTAMALEVVDPSAELSPTGSPDLLPSAAKRRRQSDIRMTMATVFEAVFTSGSARSEMLRRLCKVPTSIGLELHSFLRKPRARAETPATDMGASFVTSQPSRGSAGPKPEKRTSDELLRILEAAHCSEDLDLKALVDVHDSALGLILAQLLSEFTLDGATRLFHELAARISFFDVRNVVTSFLSRRRLVTLIYEMCVSPWGRHRGFALVVRTLPDSTQSRSAELVMGRKFGRLRRIDAGAPVPWGDGEEGESCADLVDHPVHAGKFVSWFNREDMPDAWKRDGKWRSDFLKFASQFPEVYDDVISDLRTCTEVQLKMLVEELYCILTRTDAGRVFCHYTECARMRVDRDGALDQIGSTGVDSGRGSATSSPNILRATSTLGGNAPLVSPSSEFVPHVRSVASRPGTVVRKETLGMTQMADPGGLSARSRTVLSQWSSPRPPPTPPDGQLKWTQWIILSDAIARLKQRARTRERDVRAAFQNYNAKDFCAEGTRNRERRESALQTVLDDDAAVEYIAGMSADDLDNLVFVHLTGEFATSSLPTLTDEESQRMSSPRNRPARRP